MVAHPLLLTQLKDKQVPARWYSRQMKVQRPIPTGSYTNTDVWKSFCQKALSDFKFQFAMYDTYALHTTAFVLFINSPCNHLHHCQQQEVRLRIIVGNYLHLLYFKLNICYKNKYSKTLQFTLYILFSSARPSPLCQTSTILSHHLLLFPISGSTVQTPIYTASPHSPTQQ